MAPYFIGAICSFGMSIVFAYLIPKSEYGIYKLLMSSSAVIGGLTLTGMNTAVTQAISHGHTAIYTKSITYQMRWNSVVAILTLIVLFTLQNTRNGLPFVVFLPIVIGTTLLTAYNTYAAYYSGRKDFKTLAQSQIIITLAQTLLSVLIAITSKNGAMIVAGIFTIQTIVTYIYHKKVVQKLSIDSTSEDTLDSVLLFGKKVSFINFFKILSDQADKIITFIILGPVALALYSFAYAIPDQIRGFFKIIPALSLPYFAEKNELRIRQVLRRYLLLFFCVVFVIASIYFFIAPFIFKTFFAPYSDAILYSRVIAFIMIPTVLLFPLTTYLHARKKARVLAYTNIMQAALDITGIILLGKNFGLTGVLITRAFSTTITLSVLILYVFSHTISSSDEQKIHN